MPCVIILAAGAGNRLKPYTNDRPKSLIELGGESMLERQLKTLKSCGLNDITIVTGYRNEQIKALGYPTIVNQNWSKSNMVMSLWCAFPVLKNDVVVSYADIVYQRSVLETLLASDADMSVIVDEDFKRYWELRFDNLLDDAESLTMSADGWIQSIGQKPESLDEIEAQYIGLMRFKGKGLQFLKDYMVSISETARFTRMYMTDLLQDLVNQKNSIKAVKINSGWLEIDSVKDYEIVGKKFADATISEFFDPRK